MSIRIELSRVVHISSCWTYLLLLPASTASDWPITRLHTCAEDLETIEQADEKVCRSANCKCRLDPRISYEGLRLDYAHDPDLLATCEKGRGTLETEYELYYASQAGSNSTTTPANQRSPKKSFAGRYVRKDRGNSGVSELERYFHLTSSGAIERCFPTFIVSSVMSFAFQYAAMRFYENTFYTVNTAVPVYTDDHRAVEG
ncbi:hypothetical protein B0H11DRAFT_1907372 [Mycena galericulata]|nr:hypothetical protein B0H11DRAFT_1920850 [Mycena galericulata]KAJ7502259.1 hypothetical protein B0H11DRAFT_1907372 [Mycena galericulata]